MKLRPPSLVRLAFDWIDLKLGSKKIRARPEHQSSSTSHQFRISDNAMLEVTCLERVYIIRHSRWPLTFKRTIYQINSRCTGIIDDNIRQRLDHRYTIPDLCIWMASPQRRRKQAISYFLTLVAKQLKEDEAWKPTQIG